MNVEKIILKYQEKGVLFKLNADKLGYSAPKGAIDEEAKKDIVEHKKDIMDYLTTHTSNVICDKDNLYEPFELTDIQLSYLVGRNAMYQYSGIGCKIYFEYEYPKMELSKLQTAWKQVVDNNDMLHAIICKNGTQKILKNYEIPKIKEWNMENVSEDELTIHKDSIRTRLTKKLYNPEEIPLYDIEITRLKETTIFHFSLDMLIADFGSMNLIMKELESYYYGREVSKKKLSFRDVITYKINQEKQPQYMEKAMKDQMYWKNRIETMPEAPQLPTIEDEQEISIQQYNTFISPERVKEFHNITSKYKVTLSGIVLSVYAEVLKFWSQQKDFCLNVTMTDRQDIHPEIVSVVGDFTVVDILEIQNQKDEPFGSRMETIQHQLWSDLEHSTYTGVDVLREMTKTKQKDIIMPYIYTSTLGIHNDNSHEDVGIGKLLYKISQTPQVLIDCQVIEYNGGILANWDVRKNAFPEGLIDSAFEKFSEILNTIDVETLVSTKSPVTLPGKMLACREKVNGVKCVWPDALLVEGFLENVKSNPEKEAIYYAGVSYTYKQVSEYVAAVQKELVIKGLKCGDIVAIELDKSVWQIASVLGVLFSGGTYLPIDVQQPRSRKDDILTDAKVKFVISTKKLNDKVDDNIIRVNELTVVKDAEIILTKVDPSQSAYIIYTSGSTGKPKGVVITHKAAMNTIKDIIQKFHITSEDSAICISNLAFDLSVFDIFGLLTVGGTMVIPSLDHSVSEWNQLVTEKKVTIWNTVPAQMQMLTSYRKAEQLGKEDSLRLVLLSGDWIPVKLPNEIRSNFKNSKIVSLGGATEASIWSIYYEIDPEQTYEQSIPYGIPLTNQEFYILNSNMEQCPDWVKGSLYISGKGLATEYLLDEKLTNQKFIYHEGIGKRLYLTGDCGRYLPGAIIEFCGREDYQIKIRGHRVELGEIEAKINAYPNVESAVVVTSSNNTDMLGAFVQPALNEANSEQSKNIQLLNEK